MPRSRTRNNLRLADQDLETNSMYRIQLIAGDRVGETDQIASIDVAVVEIKAEDLLTDNAYGVNRWRIVNEIGRLVKAGGAART